MHNRAKVIASFLGIALYIFLAACGDKDGIDRRGTPIPSFVINTVPAQSYTQGIIITPLDLPVATGGNAPLTYSLSPIPAGLRFNMNTRMLTGTPITPIRTNMIYTARDTDGDTATITFLVEVAANPVPSFIETIDDQVYLHGIEKEPVILPEAIGGDGDLTYRLAPLPDGMMFNSETRVLSGRPTIFGSTNLTYTATDEDMDTAELTFNVIYRALQTKNICDRTQQVEDAILAEIHKRDNTVTCDTVTELHLAEIDGTIFLSDEGITSLKADDFDGLSNLEWLDLDDNDLTNLPEDLFDGLSSLRTLHLNNNGLTTLPEDLFDGLSRLSSLWLNNNDLTTLHEDLFDGLSSLSSLGLNNNDLTTLHEDLFDGLSSLLSLWLSDNDLTTLHEDLFDGLSNLEWLWLSYNDLTTLHEDLFDGLSSLSSLGLNNNDLTTLHEDLFDGLSSLRTLTLNNNGLTTLHEDLFDGLSSLSVLDLRGNTLDAIPAICSELRVTCQTN